MVTKSELFWRLFQFSGHVGAYLLYRSYDRAQQRARRARGRAAWRWPVDEPGRVDKERSAHQAADATPR